MRLLHEKATERYALLINPQTTHLKREVCTRGTKKRRLQRERRIYN